MLVRLRPLVATQCFNHSYQLNPSDISSVSKRLLTTSGVLGGKLTTDNSAYAYPVYKTQLQICGQLYEQWASEGRRHYRGAPSRGLTAFVEYADNGLLVGDRPSDTERPQGRVLIVPGAPGSHADFSALIHHLTTKG